MFIEIEPEDLSLGYFDERIKYDRNYAKQRIEESKDELPDDLVHDLFLLYYEEKTKNNTNPITASRIKNQICKNQEKCFNEIMQSFKVSKTAIETKNMEEDKKEIKENKIIKTLGLQNIDLNFTKEQKEIKKENTKETIEEEYYDDPVDVGDEIFAWEEEYKKGRVIYNMGPCADIKKASSDVKYLDNDNIKIPEAPIEQAVKMRSENKKAEIEEEPDDDLEFMDLDAAKKPGHRKSTEQNQKEAERKELITQLTLENKVNNLKKERESMPKSRDGLLVKIKQLEYKIVGE